MRAKQVYLTGKERCAVQTLISMEIKSNMECKEMGIDPAFDTETLKALYCKLAGFEWKDYKDDEMIKMIKEVNKHEHQ